MSELLARAKTGDDRAREALFGWAYVTATAYYLAKVDVEVHLSRNDAEDLAGAFIVEFDRAWPRVSAVCRYTRRMLRNNLNRYLRKKKEERGKEARLAWTKLAVDPGAAPSAAHDGPTDEDWRRAAAVRRVLAACDPLTRRLMALRASEAELSYRDIAARLGGSEAALRMRATRFYRTVREEYGRLAHESGPSLAAEPTTRFGRSP